MKNISKDDHFTYGVFFVFGTLKMILSERVRHDDQGTAMVRVLSFSKNKHEFYPFIYSQVNSVAPGGAAEKCGIRSGDVVYSIDDTNVLNSPFCDSESLISSQDSWRRNISSCALGQEQTNRTGKILTSDDGDTSKTSNLSV